MLEEARLQSGVVEQQYEGPPRLHLCDSLRRSLTRDSIVGKSPV